MSTAAVYFITVGSASCKCIVVVLKIFSLVYNHQITEDNLNCTLPSLMFAFYLLFSTILLIIATYSFNKRLFYSNSKQSIVFSQTAIRQVLPQIPTWRQQQRQQQLVQLRMA